MFTLIQTLRASPDEHLVRDVSVGPSHSLGVVPAVDLCEVLHIRVEVAQVVVAAESLEGVA